MQKYSTNWELKYPIGDIIPNWIFPSVSPALVITPLVSSFKLTPKIIIFKAVESKLAILYDLLQVFW